MRLTHREKILKFYQSQIKLCIFCSKQFNPTGSRDNYCSLLCKLDKFTDKTTACWEWIGPKNLDGYGLLKKAGWKSVNAHRQSYELHKGKIPEGMCVCHSCDNPGCVNPVHLFLGTHMDNMDDMIKKGRLADVKGESNGRSKLNQKDVHQIRSDKRSLSAIATDYNVSIHAIWCIKKGKTWN